MKIKSILLIAASALLLSFSVIGCNTAEETTKGDMDKVSDKLKDAPPPSEDLSSFGKDGGSKPGGQ